MTFASGGNSGRLLRSISPVFPKVSSVEIDVGGVVCGVKTVGVVGKEPVLCGGADHEAGFGEVAGVAECGG